MSIFKSIFGAGVGMAFGTSFGSPIDGLKYGVTAANLLFPTWNSPVQQQDKPVEDLSRKVEAGGMKSGDEVPYIAGSGWFPGYLIKKEYVEVIENTRAKYIKDNEYNALFSLGKSLLGESYYINNDKFEIINDDISGEILIKNKNNKDGERFTKEEFEDARFFIYNKKNNVDIFENDLTDFDWNDNARNVLSKGKDNDKYWFFANNLNQNYKKFREIDINGNTIQEFDTSGGENQEFANKNNNNVFCFDNKLGNYDIYTLYQDGVYYDYYKSIEYDNCFNLYDLIHFDSSDGFQKRNIEQLYLSEDIYEYYTEEEISGTNSISVTYVDNVNTKFNLYLAASYNDDNTVSLLGCFFEPEDSFADLSGTFTNFVELENIDVSDNITDATGIFISDNPDTSSKEPLICLYKVSNDNIQIHKISVIYGLKNNSRQIILTNLDSETFIYDNQLVTEMNGYSSLDFQKFGFYHRDLNENPVLYIEPNYSLSGKYVRVILNRDLMQAKIDDESIQLQREKIKCSDILKKYGELAEFTQFDIDVSEIPDDYYIYGLYHHNQKNINGLVDQCIQYFNLIMYLENGNIFFKPTRLPDDSSKILNLQKKDIAYSDEYSTYNRDVINSLPSNMKMSFFKGGVNNKNKSIVEHYIHSENNSSKQIDTTYIDDELNASKRLFIIAGSLRKSNIKIKIETKIKYFKWSVGDFINYDNLTILITSVEIKKSTIIYEGTFFSKNDIDNEPEIPELPEYSSTDHKIFETPLLIDRDLEYIKIAGYPTTQNLIWEGFEVENKNNLRIGSKNRYSPYGILNYFLDKTESRYYVDDVSKLYIQFPINVLPDEISDDNEGMMNESNLLAVGRTGSEYSRYEIIAYKNLIFEKDISLVGSEVTHKQYIVSGLLRGLYGTEKYMNHGFGDYVFILNQDEYKDRNVRGYTGLLYPSRITDEIKYYVYSTNSELPKNPNYYNINGESKRTKNIAHLSAYRKQKDFHINWIPRERTYAKDWQAIDERYNGSDDERTKNFRIKIKDVSDNIYRTEILSYDGRISEYEYIYTEDMQSDDFFGFPILTFYISIEELGTGELPMELDTYYIENGIRY